LHSANYVDQHLVIDVYLEEVKALVLHSDNDFYVSLKADTTFIPFSNVLKINYEHNKMRNGVWINGNYHYLPITVASDKPIEFEGNKYNGMFKLISSQKGSIKIINSVELEDYIAGVIPFEIGIEAPYEALKAQAVAARTHTIHQLINSKHKDDGYDLCNKTHCQVYKGLSSQTEKTYRAAIETSNQILIVNNKVINAVYHSCCGGSTEDVRDAWGGRRSYLTHVNDSRAKDNNVPYCSLGGKYVKWYQSAYQWSLRKSKEELGKTLKIGRALKIEVIKRGKSGRIHRMKVIGTNGSKTLSGELEIRRIFNNAKSSNFNIVDNGSYFSISGKGFGHGVGMCQIGAIVQAHLGYSYDDILLLYFTGAEISSDWILDDIGIE